MKDDGGRVIGLEARNIMQLRAVEIDLQGKDLVIISGMNGVGKSTALDIFAMTVWGAGLCPTEPISEGKREGFSRVEMVDYIATRKFWLTAKNELASKVILKSKDGAEFKSPHEMLKKILGPVTTDPLEFTRKIEKEPKKARDLLLQLAKIEIDLEEMARARKEIYDNRTRVNKERKNKEGELAGMGRPDPGLLVDEISLSGLQREYQDALKVKQNNDQTREKLEEEEKGEDRNNREIENIQSQIKTMEREIKDRHEYLDNLHKSLKEYGTQKEALQQQVDALVDPDFETISQKTAEAEGTNKEIRAAKTLQEKRTMLGILIESTTDESHRLTHEIDELDAQKDGALQGAEFPVKGLSVDENGIRFNGFPLAQASKSEWIKIGLAISTKMNPKATLIRIYEGSSLDSENMQIIKEFARENKLAILVEVVDETGNVGIVIKDGVVAKVN